MKNSPYQLIVILFLSFAYPDLGAAQDNLSYDLQYEVNKVLPSISITRVKLKEANTLLDLNSRYKSSWIRTYHSVEISASLKGNIKRVISKNNTLSQAQKDMMEMADVGTDIAVKVKYVPENTLVNNELKEMNFTFIVDPEVEATYTGGPQQLTQYLKDNGIEKITRDNINQYNLAAVKFAINEDGKVIDAHIAETSKDKLIDQLLLESICNMPDWSPAMYANGTRVQQKFVLSVGDHTSCVVNLLNIRRLD